MKNDLPVLNGRCKRSGGWRLLITALVFLAGIFCGENSRAQEHRVTGRVTNSNGEPLAGVSIRLKDANAGTNTDGDGQYALSLPDGSGTLVFSYLGFLPLEEPVNNRSTVDVMLREDVKALHEVVVTSLGIERSQRSLGYAVSEVKSADLVKAANPNVMKSLDGKISGVNLTNLSSDPTSSVLVNIRGTTAMPSLSSGADVSVRSQPL